MVIGLLREEFLNLGLGLCQKSRAKPLSKMSCHTPKITYKLTPNTPQLQDPNIL
jgi:hypothetical protein